MSENSHLVVITGMGITSALGQGKEIFCQHLLEGRSSFSVLQRAGRQKESMFIGGEIAEFVLPERVSPAMVRNVSLSGKIAAATLHEAWEDAKLEIVSPEKIGLVVGGSNLQQREWLLLQEKYREIPYYMPPYYGFAFMDTDLCGFCSEQFNIRGLAYTVGGASASGQMAVIHAVQAVVRGEVDVCIALGALMDVSYFELHAFRSLGAMGGLQGHTNPQKAYRPFDINRDGFIYGESCAAIVVEKVQTASNRNAVPYAEIIGWANHVDGNRNPNPSLDGEIGVIKKVLENADLSADEIDYINPHGSGSLLGDEIELRALKESKLNKAFINTTKSITGHGLSAAGAVEIVATVLQMKAKKLHPSINLEYPLDESFNWVTTGPVNHTIKNALSLSFGFAGINTAICLHNCETSAE